MPIIKTNSLPVCPNHNCDLKDLPNPLPNKGTGVCPVSGCKFDFVIEIDKTEIKIDINGNPTKQVKWSVVGDEKNNN